MTVKVNYVLGGFEETGLRIRVIFGAKKKLQSTCAGVKLFAKVVKVDKKSCTLYSHCGCTRICYRMQRRASVPRSGRARALQQFWHGFFNFISSCDRRQLEWHHEGYVARRVRRPRGLRAQLLRFVWNRAHVFCHFRADGAVRAGERGGGCAHEAFGRIAQAGR